jgi:rhodanese-related sulfurtransferase
MKKLSLLLALASMTFCASAQVKSGAFRLMLDGLLGHSVPEIGVAAAARAQDSIVFLDARERREYDVSHLRGARHVGYDAFDPRALDGLPRTQRVVVYCSVGYRSEKISEKLLAAGFTNVANLYGGIFEWVNQGHPVYDGAGRTDAVHAYDRVWGVWLKKGKKVYN